MATIVRIQPLAASTGHLAQERARLAREIEEMEKHMATTTPTQTDDMIRALKTEVDAEEARLAEKRALLARAEAQRQVLAKDRAAAAAAEHQAAIDAAKQSLRAEVDAYLSDYAALVRNLRGAAGTIGSLLARMREIGVLCQSLDAGGKVPIICDRVEHEKRMAYLVVHAMRRIPGKRERLGAMVWPAYADAEHPVDLDPVERERDRLQRHVLDALAQVED
jgi:multidrug efflux pump subunit AcrA (membrane-fusion protein)